MQHGYKFKISLSVSAEAEGTAEIRFQLENQFGSDTKKTRYTSGHWLKALYWDYI